MNKKYIIGLCFKVSLLLFFEERMNARLFWIVSMSLVDVFDIANDD